MINHLLKLAANLKKINTKQNIITKIALLIQDYSNSSEYGIVSFREKLIKIPIKYWYGREDVDSMPDDEKQQYEKILEQLIEIYGEEFKGDISDIVQNLRDKKDVIVGTIKNNELSVDSPGDSPSPRSSPYLKKIIKELGLRSTSYMSMDSEGEDTEYTYHDSNMLGDIPNNLFHGSSSKYLQEYLKYGLRNDSSFKTNFKNSVKHDKVIFLASELSTAMFYAGNSAGYTNSRPIVIEVDVSSIKNFLHPDWDVDNASETKMEDIYNQTWEDLETHDLRRDKTVSDKIRGKSTTYSKHFGKFGLNGRIPASSIKNIFVKNYDGWIEFSPQELSKLLKHMPIEEFNETETYIPYDVDQYIEEMENYEEE